MLLQWLRQFGSRPEFCAKYLQTFGIKHLQVAEFQAWFNNKVRKFGIVAAITGVYDQQTVDAVSKFQLRVWSIYQADGFVGPRTARRLGIKLVGE